MLGAFLTAVVDTTVTQILSLLIVTALIVRWATKKKLNEPPGPRPLPLLGNVLDFRGSSLVAKTLEWKNTYGPVVRFYLGLRPCVVLGSIEALTEAYLQRGSDFANKPHLTSLDSTSNGGSNIAFAPYSEALVYRRKIAMQAIRQYLTGAQHTDRINDIVISDVVNMAAEKGPFSLHRHLSHIIFNILHGLCFGYMLELQDPTYSQLQSFFDRTGGNVSGFIEDFFPLLKHWPTRRFRELIENVNFFRDYILKHIGERRARFDENNIENLVDSIILAQKQLGDDVDEKIKAGFTDVHVNNIIRDVFFAGVDTSRNTLEWLFLVLAANQDVQRKIQEEIDTVIGDNVPGREHRQGLVYTEAVLLEVMRMHLVVPMGLPHETIRDTKVGGYEIPGKTQVYVNLHAILNDPAHWDEPEKFMPERFIEEDGTKLKLRPKSWTSFGVGPRNCVGEFLAKQNLLYAMVGVLQKLQFSLVPGTGQPDFTPVDRWLMRVCKPYKVVAIPRTSSSS